MAQRTGPITACVHEKLLGLIEASALATTTITPEAASRLEPMSWLPLLSLPQVLGVTPENPIATESYLRVPEEAQATWQHRLCTARMPLVGINWQGNPRAEANSNLKGRSLSLNELQPLAEIDSIRLLSLQKGAGSEQVAQSCFSDRFIPEQHLVDEAWDFIETAAIVQACDLIITSYTMVAHLAGGLGKPVWLLLAHVPDWRWGLEGEQSFWYPTMRLFRQRQRGEWGEVVNRVATAVRREWAGG